MPIKVKEEHKGTVVGFNNSSLPLGKRDDLHILLDDCIGDNDEPRSKYVLSFFSQIPTKKEIQELKKKDLLKKATKISRKN